VTTLDLSADAPVVAAVFNRRSSHVAFGLGDGTVRIVLPDSAQTQEGTLTDGAVLSLVADADDAGWLAGLDDGRLVRLSPDGAVTELASHKGKWIEHVAASPAGGRAYGAGKDVFVGDASGFGPAREHPSTVGGIAFDPKGKRVAVAHYGGVSLWWVNSAEGKPKLLPWKGSHIAVSWSLDGAYVMTAMQENDLHGWRLPGANDIRMSGYPSKVHGLAWSAKPSFLATSGADQVICWPFSGTGPSGKPPIEFGIRGTTLVTQVACHPAGDLLAIGYESGEVTFGRITQRRIARLLDPTGSPVVALAWSADGRWVASGDEDGHMRVTPAPSTAL
jgi:WD40 repeat protein